MKKFYTLFLSLAVMSVSSGALAQTPAMKLLPATKTVKTEKQLKSAKQKARLEAFAAKATAFPDSILIYSGDGEKTGRRLLDFFPNGKIKNVESYDWETGEGWIPSSKEGYAYDAKENEILNEWYEWNDTINAWVGEVKEVALFDDKGEKILKEAYTWNKKLNTWETTPSSKVERTFNAAGKLLLRISTEKRDDSPTYKNEEANVYNDQGFLMTNETSYWEDNVLGNKIEKEYERDSYGNVTQLRSNYWDTENNSIAYVTTSIYTHSLDASGRPLSTLETGEDIYGELTPISRNIFEYDANNNVIYQEEHVRTWNESGDSIAWSLSLKKTLKYNDKGYKLFDEHLQYTPDDFVYGNKTVKEYDDRFGEDEDVLTLNYSMADTSSWVLNHKSISVFDEIGNYLLDESYSTLDGDLTPRYKDVWTYDKNGIESTYKEYVWENDNWVLEQYGIVYPFTASVIEVEEIKPIDQSGKDGKFELALNIPAESTLTGSYTITLPQGFTLDQNATKLVDALATGFGLTFTDKGNNSWLIEIKAKGTRAVSNEIVFQKVMDVAYTLNVNADATYEIKLSNIDFKLANGADVKQELLTVEVGVKTGLGIDNNELEQANVYVSNGALFVSNDVSELITVYTVTGLKVFSTHKDAGELRVGALPSGILIVKGSTGWTAKVIK